MLTLLQLRVFAADHAHVTRRPQHLARVVRAHVQLDAGREPRADEGRQHDAGREDEAAGFGDHRSHSTRQSVELGRFSCPNVVAASFETNPDV
jgi:hypothetical protein